MINIWVRCTDGYMRVWTDGWYAELLDGQFNVGTEVGID